MFDVSSDVALFDDNANTLAIARIVARLRYDLELLLLDPEPTEQRREEMKKALVEKAWRRCTDLDPVTFSKRPHQSIDN